MKADVPPTVLDLIFKWSEGNKHAWQRDALRRIIEYGELYPKDIEDLTALCRRGAGDTLVQEQPIPLGESHLQTQNRPCESVSLHSIRDVRGVNRLAGGQVLSFGTAGMTIIYGPNGSGKSNVIDSMLFVFGYKASKIR